VAIFALYSFAGLALFKATLYQFLAQSRLKNYNTRNILVIGSRQRTLDFIKAVRRRKESGYRIIGCLETNDKPELVGERVYESVKIIGTMDNFKDLLKNETIDEVVFGLPLKKVDNAHEYIYFAEEIGKNVRVLPDFQINKIKYYPQTAQVNIEDFLGVTTMVLSSVPKNTNQLLLKACIDYAGAFLGITILSPLLLIIAIAIKLTSKGPVLFSQERSGLNGRRFQLLKFRTMVVNAEELKAALMSENEVDGPVFKMKKDPRITWIGRFLRKTSLDELPQLFNVMRSEMSLVGPRPPIPAEVEHYQVWQRRRLSMKPGLTCIWQVSGRNNISFDQWMTMDLEYIDNWSLGLDIKLLLLTVKEVAFGGGR
jgi:exopolysaccharide biosynthesis polyprenyl glycosylphosphotransferase